MPSPTRTAPPRRSVRTVDPLSAFAVAVMTLTLVMCTVAFVSLAQEPRVRARASPPVTPPQAAPRPTAPPPTAPPPTAVGAAPTLAPLTTPCRETVRACVQLSTQHVWLLADGRVVRDGFVSSGTTDMETPTGAFRVQYKDAAHYSSEYDTPMPYAVFFDTNGDALHEGSLGRQSRGCVHLTHPDAVAFFDALAPGDEVQILP